MGRKILSHFVVFAFLITNLCPSFAAGSLRPTAGPESSQDQSLRPKEIVEYGAGLEELRERLQIAAILPTEFATSPAANVPAAVPAPIPETPLSPDMEQAAGMEEFDLQRLIREANTAIARKDFSAAVTALESAVKIDPKDVAIWTNLGIAYSEQNYLPEAIAAFEHAIEVDPGYALAWTNLGIAYFEQGNLPEAMVALERAVKVDPEHAVAWYNLGTVYADQSKLSEARTAFERATEADPGLALAWYNLGLAHYHQGKLSEAIAAYKRATEADPKHVLTWNNLGLVYYHQGKLSDAITAYEQAIVADPTYVPVWYNLGLAYSKRGYLPGAIDAFQTVVELDPEYKDTKSHLARAEENLYGHGQEPRSPASGPEEWRERLGFRAWAITLGFWVPIKVALRRFDMPTRRILLGMIKGLVNRLVRQKIDPRPTLEVALPRIVNYSNLTEGDFAVVLDWATRLADSGIDPYGSLVSDVLVIAGTSPSEFFQGLLALESSVMTENAVAWTNRGLSYYSQGKLSDAMAAFERAIEVNPMHATAWDGLGISYLGEGNLSEAMAAFKRAIVANPKYASAWNNLGKVYSDQGKLSDAVIAFEGATKVDPQLAGAWHNLGVIYADQGKVSEAIAAYKRAIEADPQLAPAWYNLGLAYSDQGQLSDAISAFQRVMELDPEYRDTKSHLARAEEELYGRGQEPEDPSAGLEEDVPETISALESVLAQGPAQTRALGITVAPGVQVGFDPAYTGKVGPDVRIEGAELVYFGPDGIWVRSGDEVGLFQDGLDVPAGTVISAAGLEEQTKLTWKAWLATLGAWGPVREALKQFDKPIRKTLRGQINGLVKRLVERSINPRPFLRNILPELFSRTMTPEQFATALHLAIRLVERGIDPHLTLAEIPTSVVPDISQEELSAGLFLAMHLADREIDPHLLFDSVSLGRISYASGTFEIFQANLKVLEDFLIRLWKQGIVADYAIYYGGIRTAIEASSTSKVFETNLSVLEELIIRLKATPKLRWKKVEPADLNGFTKKAIRFRRQGRGYTVKVKSKRGLYQYDLVPRGRARPTPPGSNQAGLEESVAPTVEQVLGLENAAEGRARAEALGISVAPEATVGFHPEFRGTVGAGVQVEGPNLVYFGPDGVWIRDGDEVALFQDSLDVADGTVISLAGMEEQRERLSWKAWWATLGAWGPTRTALKRFDKPVRPALKGAVRGAINRIVEERKGNYFVARYALAYGVPIVAELSANEANFYKYLHVLEDLVLDLTPLLTRKPYKKEGQVKGGAFKKIVYNPSWEKLSPAQFGQLVREAISLRADGVSFELRVRPEEGQVVRGVRGYTHDGTWNSGYPTGEEWFDEYIVDSPQDIRLIAKRTPPATPESEQAGLEEIGTPEVAEVALEEGDMVVFGRLMDDAFGSYRDNYEIAVADLEELIGIARGVEGVLGANLQGAGFGGFSIALVPDEALERFTDTLVQKYYEPRGLTRSEILGEALFVGTPSRGAGPILPHRVTPAAPSVGLETLKEALDLDQVRVHLPQDMETLDFSQGAVLFIDAGVATRFRGSVEARFVYRTGLAHLAARILRLPYAFGLLRPLLGEVATTETNKILVDLNGRPAGIWPKLAARRLGLPVISVVGARKEDVMASFRAHLPEIIFAEQKPLSQGTGHAAYAGLAVKALREAPFVIVGAGDQPLFDEDVFAEIRDTYLAGQKKSPKVDLVVTVAEVEDPTDKGRVVTDRDDPTAVLGIVEHKDILAMEDGEILWGYTRQELLDWKQVNVSLYAGHPALLQELLAETNNANIQGEFYMTDIVGWLVSQERRVTKVEIDAWRMPDVTELENLRKVARLMKEKGLVAAGREQTVPVLFDSDQVRPDIRQGLNAIHERVVREKEEEENVYGTALSAARSLYYEEFEAPTPAESLFISYAVAHYSALAMNARAALGQSIDRQHLKWNIGDLERLRDQRRSWASEVAEDREPGSFWRDWPNDPALTGIREDLAIANKLKSNFDAAGMEQVAPAVRPWESAEKLALMGDTDRPAVEVAIARYINQLQVQNALRAAEGQLWLPPGVTQQLTRWENAFSLLLGPKATADLFYDGLVIMDSDLNNVELERLEGVTVIKAGSRPDQIFGNLRVLGARESDVLVLEPGDGLPPTATGIRNRIAQSLGRFSSLPITIVGNRGKINGMPAAAFRAVLKRKGRLGEPNVYFIGVVYKFQDDLRREHSLIVFTQV